MNRAIDRVLGHLHEAFSLEWVARAAFRSQRRQDFERAAGPDHRHLLSGLLPGENPDGLQVHMRRIPPRAVACVPVLDSLRTTVFMDAAARVVTWAESKGVADGHWLVYMWDDPEIVALEAR